MSYQLFSIPTKDENEETVIVDFTRFITVPSYKVNEFDISEDWEDGNKKKHKHIVRTQAKGTFTLKFNTADEFNNFFSIVNQYKIRTGDNSGAVLVNVYLQNKDTVKSIYMFIDADPEDTLPLLGTGSYEGFTVTVEEV